MKTMPGLMGSVPLVDDEGAPTGSHERPAVLSPSGLLVTNQSALLLPSKSFSVSAATAYISKLFIKSLMGISCGHPTVLPMVWK